MLSLAHVIRCAFNIHRPLSESHACLQRSLLSRGTRSASCAVCLLSYCCSGQSVTPLSSGAAEGEGTAQGAEGASRHPIALLRLPSSVCFSPLSSLSVCAVRVRCSPVLCPLPVRRTRRRIGNTSRDSAWDRHGDECVEGRSNSSDSFLPPRRVGLGPPLPFPAQLRVQSAPQIHTTTSNTSPLSQSSCGFVLTCDASSSPLSPRAARCERHYQRG